MPVFSIIIPTFNRNQSLERAINSVLSQSFSDFEILVMDDGSTDGTDIFIQSIKDPRIFYEWKKNSGGPAKPRNRGIDNSRGEWICFLDADDYWTPDKLQRCLDGLNSNVDFLYHDLFLFNKKTKLESVGWSKLKSRKLSMPIIEDLLLNGNAISTSSVIVRRTILEKTNGFDEDSNVMAAEDFKLWLEIATLTNNFKYIKLSLGYYLDLGSGISNKNMSFVYFNAIKSYLNILDEGKVNSAISFPKYINAKYVISKQEFSTCFVDLIFCVKYGKAEIKLKSIFLIFKSILKLTICNLKINKA